MPAIGPEPPPCDHIPSLTKGVTPALRLIGRPGLLGACCRLSSLPRQQALRSSALQRVSRGRSACNAPEEPLALRNEVSRGDVLRTGVGARLRVDLRDGFNFLFPAATIALTCAVIVGSKYAVAWRRQRFIRDAFSRYLHADLGTSYVGSRLPCALAVRSAS